MKLIQIFLPLYNEENELFPLEFYLSLRKDLTEKFGGITTYSRSPATGLWKENKHKTVIDEIIIYEVMVKEMKIDWWKNLKKSLEVKFNQDEIVIRAMPIELL